MKTSDSLIPYNLMSLHPLMHITLLTTGLLMLGLNSETFYQVDGTVPDTIAYAEAYDFIAGKKKTLMNLSLMSHVVCLLSHWTYQILSHYEIKVMANIFLMLKMMFYFVTTLRI